MTAAEAAELWLAQENENSYKLSLHYKQETEGTNKKWHKAFNINAYAVLNFLRVGCTTQTSQTRPPNGDQVFKYPGLWGTFLTQTTIGSHSQQGHLTLAFLCVSNTSQPGHSSQDTAVIFRTSHSSPFEEHW